MIVIILPGISSSGSAGVSSEISREADYEILRGVCFRNNPIVSPEIWRQVQCLENPSSVSTEIPFGIWSGTSPWVSGFFDEFTPRFFQEFIPVAFFSGIFHEI